MRSFGDIENSERIVAMVQEVENKSSVCMCECVFVFQHVSNIRGTVQVDLRLFSCLCSGPRGQHATPRPAAPPRGADKYSRIIYIEYL